jgi:hypothetical protein
VRRALTCLLAALPVLFLAAAARAADPWPAIDAHAKTMDRYWNDHQGRYRLSPVSSVRVSAGMLTVHAIAALTGHQGAARADNRAAALARALTQEPAFVGPNGREGRPQPHRPGFRDASHQHVSLDPLVLEALRFAYAARAELALDEATVRAIGDVARQVALGPFYRYPAIRLNQFNWHADVDRATTEVTGDASFLQVDYRRQLGRFVAGMHQPTWGAVSANLNEGWGLRYHPGKSADDRTNVSDSSEYANLVVSGLAHYDRAVELGMKPLAPRDEAALRTWSCRVLLGDWTHAGRLSWDSGLGVARAQLNRYWGFATRGLLTIATAGRLSCGARERRWAEWMLDRTLAAWARETPADGFLPAVPDWWRRPGAERVTGDGPLASTRMAAMAARVAVERVGPGERPPPFFAHDRDVRRLVVSTPSYAAAILGRATPLQQGGIGLGRLFGAGGAPIATAAAPSGGLFVPLADGAPATAVTGPLRVASDLGSRRRGAFGVLHASGCWRGTCARWRFGARRIAVDAVAERATHGRLLVRLGDVPGLTVTATPGIRTLHAVAPGGAWTAAVTVRGARRVRLVRAGLYGWAVAMDARARRAVTWRMTLDVEDSPA